MLTIMFYCDNTIAYIAGYIGIYECRWRRLCESTSKLAGMGGCVHSVVYNSVAYIII